MLEIAICDDENIFAEKLKSIVADYLDSMQIPYKIDTYPSGKALLNMDGDVKKYKIIFLDISMGEIDGISTARKIRAITDEPYIVFVTAFINYAFTCEPPSSRKEVNITHKRGSTQIIAITERIICVCDLYCIIWWLCHNTMKKIFFQMIAK